MPANPLADRLALLTHFGTLVREKALLDEGRPPLLCVVLHGQTEWVPLWTAPGATSRAVLAQAARALLKYPDPFAVGVGLIIDGHPTILAWDAAGEDAFAFVPAPDGGVPMFQPVGVSGFGPLTGLLGVVEQIREYPESDIDLILAAYADPVVEAHLELALREAGAMRLVLAPQANVSIPHEAIDWAQASIPALSADEGDPSR